MTELPRVLLCLSSVRSQMGGGSIAMWRLAEALEARGCILTVAAVQSGPAAVRGRTVRRPVSEEEVRGADLVLVGEGDAADVVCRLARRTRSGARIVSFVHSVARELSPVPARVDHLVWASESMRAFARARGFAPPCPESVMWPLIDPAAVRVQPGDAVTLVNPLPEKGGDLVWDIAALTSGVRFLVVRGGWRRGRQVIPAELPENVEVLPYQEDSREIFRRTRILLYPKGREAGPGWMRGVGMTALEAACSGIPTIAYPGAGLVEALGDAGTWVGGFDPGAWAQAIRDLLVPDAWRRMSDKAAFRAGRLDPDDAVGRMLALAAPAELAVAS